MLALQMVLVLALQMVLVLAKLLVSVLVLETVEDSQQCSQRNKLLVSVKA